MTPLFEEIAAMTGLGVSDLQRIVQNAPSRYKVFPIAKRNGGFRVIAQPARELKRLQRALMEVVLNKLPVHSCATAYREGSSILENAMPHAANGPILKLDLKDFFPSIRSSDWARYCHSKGCLKTEQDISWTSQILFRHDPRRHGLRLSIGAPSSPMISNILMYGFDEIISHKVGRERVTYTRYADDMTFSAPRTGFLNHVKSAVTEVINDLESPRIWLNDSKTTLVTRKYHRTVTGLTLANDGRVTIGKHKKRLIRAMVHRGVLGHLDQDQLRVLTGILAYVNAVEPAFVGVLRNKYGSENITQLQKAVLKGGKLPSHSPPIAHK